VRGGRSEGRCACGGVHHGRREGRCVGECVVEGVSSRAGVWGSTWWKECVMSVMRVMVCSLDPRPSTPPVFDCLQYAKTEGEGLGFFIT